MSLLPALAPVTAAVQRRLLWITLLAHALAATWPAPGEACMR
jgi:hypothetical protein